MGRINNPDTLASVIQDLLHRLDRLENARRSQVALVSADPATPVNGDIWLRSDTGALRIRVAGVTKTATLT